MKCSRIAAAVAVAVTISACATTTSTKGFDSAGAEVQVIHCNGATNSMATCLEEANRTCPSGYVRVSSQERGGESPLAIQSADIVTVLLSRNVQRELVIRCKA
jgi:hypothetical protein